MAITINPSGRSSRSKSTSPIEIREKVGSRVTIYKTTASPNWYIDYSIDGRQFRRSLKTRSKKQALKLAEDKAAQLVLGVAVAQPKRGAVVADAIAAYLKQQERRGRQRGTLSVYGVDLKDFQAYAHWRGMVKLDRVTAEFLEEYEERLKTKGLEGIVAKQEKGAKRRPSKSNTIHNKLKVVRQLIRWAVRRGLLREDPSPGYTLPPRSSEQAYCWLPDELSRILQHAEDDTDVFNFLRMTGLRADEFCMLMKEDVDWNRPHVKIRAKTCPESGRRWKPKHGNERIVPLCPEALEIVKRATQHSTGPWLFRPPATQKKGKGRYTAARLRRAVKRAMKAAGVEKGTTHTFRHYFCSFMANQNVPPLKVMKIMGHRSLNIILTYYHVDDQELLGAFEGLSFATVGDKTGKQASSATAERGRN
jgi:integrase